MMITAARSLLSQGILILEGAKRKILLRRLCPNRRLPRRGTLYPQLQPLSQGYFPWKQTRTRAKVLQRQPD